MDGRTEALNSQFPGKAFLVNNAEVLWEKAEALRCALESKTESTG